ncbi:hypothetical protein V4P56_05710 [Bartonella sp. B35(2025)]
MPTEEDKQCVRKILEGVTNRKLYQSFYEFGCAIFAEKNNTEISTGLKQQLQDDEMTSYIREKNELVQNKVANYNSKT